MAQAKAINANSILNGNSTVLHGNSSNVNSLMYNELGDNRSPKPAPISGVMQKVLNGNFAHNSEGVYKNYTRSLAGNTNVAMQAPRDRKNVDGWRGYNISKIDSINFASGTVVYGSANGHRVVASGINGTTGVLADHTLSVIPGELVYQKGSLVPVQADY